MTNLGFQEPLFLRGYQMCRLKNGIDPIPHDGTKALLPYTKEYKQWMDGWNLGLYEIQSLSDYLAMKTKEQTLKGIIE